MHVTLRPGDQFATLNKLYKVVGRVVERYVNSIFDF